MGSIFTFYCFCVIFLLYRFLVNKDEYIESEEPKFGGLVVTTSDLRLADAGLPRFRFSEKVRDFM